VAVKDSIGGWKDNAHIFKTPKACSALKMLAGIHFTSTTEALGMHNVHGCPIPAVWKYYINKNVVMINVTFL